MKVMLIRCLAIGAAGSIGAIARFLVGALVGRMNIRFPLGTLIINISGCLFLGWFLTRFGTRNISDVTRLAIGTGFVGAYTTFSTFIYESSALMSERAWIAATTNLLGSLVLGLLAVRLGSALARWM